MRGYGEKRKKDEVREEEEEVTVNIKKCAYLMYGTQTANERAREHKLRRRYFYPPLSLSWEKTGELC